MNFTFHQHFLYNIFPLSPLSFKLQTNLFSPIFFPPFPDQDEEMGSACSQEMGSDGEKEEGEEENKKPNTFQLLPDLLHLTPHALPIPQLPNTPKTEEMGLGPEMGKVTPSPSRGQGGESHLSPPSSSFPNEADGEGEDVGEMGNEE